MPLKHLYHLTALKVPNDYLRVFTAAYNVLRFCVRKARNYAIRSVHVSSISLDTTRGVVIPETDCGILGRRKHKFRILREFDMRA